MKVETIKCDICESEIEKYRKLENGNTAEHKSEDIQVIFVTEQNEGRASKPHLVIQKLDICDKCREHILMGSYVYAEGAQGNNRYYFVSK